MIRPLALYIGLRYTRAKRRNHFISFISFASMIGIALGVMVLITVLSVMNGFDYQIRTQFFALAPEVTVLSENPITDNWQQTNQQIEKISGITGSAPYVSGKGLIIQGSEINGVEVFGILPQQERKVSKLYQKVVSGSLNSLVAGKYNIVIGGALADRLNAKVGDKINIFTPQPNVTLAGIFPRSRQFTVSGIFTASSGLGISGGVVFINLYDAAKLFPGRTSTSGFHVKLNNLYQADPISLKIQHALQSSFIVTNWTRQYGTFFKALSMEKTMLFVILLFIVGIAAFNLVSTLVMVVNDKRADIAILRTLGASPGTIMATFIIQGAVVGMIGTLIGLVFGLILALNVTDLYNWIVNTFNVRLIPSSVYFIDFLPSRIQLSDIVTVCVIAFGLSLIATIYPASIAFRTQPAEALRYE